jgi:hypothetical protein
MALTICTADSLTALDQWIVWRFEQRNDKPTKVPYQINGSRASSTDPRTWCSWDGALKASQDNPRCWCGVGFVFSATDPFFGIDLDQCLDTDGKLKPWAQPIMARFLDTYAEISPRGQGIKIWANGRLPGGGTAFPFEDGRIEIYDQARYFTVTGNHWAGLMLDVGEHQSDLDWLLGLSPGRHGNVPAAAGKISKSSLHDTVTRIGAMPARGGESPKANTAPFEVNGSALEAPISAARARQIARQVFTHASGNQQGNDGPACDQTENAEMIRIREIAVAGLTGPEPQTPDVLALLEIHRHRDGVVTFHRKGTQPGQFENLFGVRAKDLPEIFASRREELDCDSYFSINAFWHRDQKRKVLPASEVRQPDRLRLLCAAYADLDIHNLGIDFGTALAAALRYQDEGVIPPASMIVRSGRGMWLLWFLHDAKCPIQPPRAFPEKLSLYLKINRAIGERLSSLGADAAARDAVRLMRIPGSVHPLATECPRVKYWIQSDERGKPYSYTLGDLALRLSVTLPVASKECKALLAADLPAGIGSHGPAQLTVHRLREFSILRGIRGGFVAGCRNHAVLVYAWLLRRNLRSHEEVLHQAQLLAAECRPPLSAVETGLAVKTAMNRKFCRIRDQTISDWLGITSEESAHLERFAPASRFARERSAVPETTRQLGRRTAMHEVLGEHCTVPSCREMVRLLRQRQIEVSHTQILRDYKALGVKAGT